MTKIEKLEKEVRELYESKDPKRADWADWLFENHVFVVADYAEQLAKRFDADIELCRAAAILHDIADAKMSRFDPEHEEASLDIACQLLKDAGFETPEVVIVVDDAIRLHSCHDGKRPETLVGRILATADALAHLETNFYEYTTENLMPDKTESERNSWAAKKIPRDYHDKIAFEAVRRDAKPYYEKLSAHFVV